MARIKVEPAEDRRLQKSRLTAQRLEKVQIERHSLGSAVSGEPHCRLELFDLTFTKSVTSRRQQSLVSSPDGTRFNIDERTPVIVVSRSRPYFQSKKNSQKDTEAERRDYLNKRDGEVVYELDESHDGFLRYDLGLWRDEKRQVTKQRLA